MLTLNFKKSHIGYCASFMMGGSISQYFYLVTAIRNQLLSDTYGMDDLISITIEDQDLIDLYSYLGYQSERTASKLNADMKNTLVPQLITIAGNNTEQSVSAQTVIAKLTEIDTNSATARDEGIQIGIDWLTK